jgi:putative NADH-flavin reductase
LRELTSRGHQVTAIARHPEKVAAGPNVTAKRGDVSDKAGLAALLKGHDVVVSSLRFADLDAAGLIDIVRASGLKRFLIVGGAASLEVAPGKRLLVSPSFPEAYRAEASKAAAFLDLLKGVKDLDWTFLSPSAIFVAGERTGIFRLGKDQLLSDASGKSTISYEDYAIALADEIEKPTHIKQRFTVGY